MWYVPVTDSCRVSLWTQYTHNWQDGVSQPEETPPLFLPQPNHLNEIFLVRGEDVSNVAVTPIPFQNRITSKSSSTTSRLRPQVEVCDLVSWRSTPSSHTATCRHHSRGLGLTGYPSYWAWGLGISGRGYPQTCLMVQTHGSFKSHLGCRYSGRLRSKPRGGESLVHTRWNRGMVYSVIWWTFWGHWGRSDVVWTKLEICHTRQMG